MWSMRKLHLHPTLMATLVLLGGVLACMGRSAPKEEVIIPPQVTPLQVTSSECKLKINQEKNDLPKNQPLLLRPGGPRDSKGFYLPDQNGVIHFSPGQEVFLVCPGKKNVIDVLNTPNVTAYCVGGTTFSVAKQKQNHIFSTLTCNDLITHTARLRPGGKCEIPGSYNLIDIGFELSNKTFYSIMEVCFDPINLDAIYAKFVQTPSISGEQIGEARPSFAEGQFYPKVSVNSQYNREGQKNAVAQAVGSNELASTYIQDKGDYYLARGHLTAKADYVYASHQRATFWYVNVAPQWQTFNGGNWNFLEASVRKFVASYGKDVTVYTGTHGLLKLADVNGVEVPLYLSYDNNNNGQIKVPEVFWKVLYDNSTKVGIAFVGVNNPYAETYTPLCKDVCDRVNWVSWQPKKQKLGFGYCCDVNDLRKEIKTIPKFTVTGLLH